MIGQNVSIGAYTIIEDNVDIGNNTSIGNHNTICSGTQIGSECKIYHNNSIGEVPQDLKYDGEDTLTLVGDNVIIREFVTINRGTSAEVPLFIVTNSLIITLSPTKVRVSSPSYFKSCGTSPIELL